MVAMMIGLFLLTGIASSYISSHRSSTERDQISSVEDNGRLALEIISNIVEHAGYAPPNPGAQSNFSAFIRTSDDVLSANCINGSKSILDKSLFNAANRVVSDSPSGDSLGVIYYSDDRVFRDCGANELPSACRLAAIGSKAKNMKPEASRIYSSFFLDSNSKQLKCVGSRGKRVEVIAEGVENIQYLYGVDVGKNSAKRYMNATSISSSKLWGEVESVQIAILVRSLKPVERLAESKTYTLLDQVVKTPKDRYKRTVFTTSVRVRNNSN